MNIQKKILNKSELLEWLNLTLGEGGQQIQKIQQLGTGVAYLALLSHLHPQVLQGVKYNRKPNNQYEYIHNLKVLANAFSRLGIEKHVDIQKLSKLKMQDNLAFLQWFYAYAQELPTKQPQQAEKKVKVKGGQKLNFTLPDKTSKMEIEQDHKLDLKTASSASKRIHEIKQIIHCHQIETNEDKLQQIKQILGFNKIKNRIIGIPSKSEVRNYTNHNGFKIKNENEPEANNIEKEFRSNTLHSRYEEYMKSIIKKPETHPEVKIEGSKPGRQSVRLAPNHQVFQYQPWGSEVKSRRKSARLTDNSILLQSDRKSVQSQTNLLQNETDP